MANFITAANKVIDESGAKEKELWVSGSLSSIAREEMARRGWKLHEAGETQLFKWTQGNPQ